MLPNIPPKTSSFDKAVSRMIALPISRHRAIPSARASRFQGHPKGHRARNRFRRYVRALVGSGVDPAHVASLYVSRFRRSGTVLSVDKVVKDFNAKHSYDMHLTANVALSANCFPDNFRDVGFDRETGVLPTGELKFTLPDNLGSFLFSQATVPYILTGGASQVEACAPILFASGPATPNRFYVYDDGDNVQGGVVTFPISSQVPQYNPQGILNMGIGLNFGATTTMLAVSGIVGTAAVEGPANNTNTLLTRASPTIAPMGSWKAALGPLHNDLSDRNYMYYSSDFLINTGSVQLDNNSPPLYSVTPAGWVVGAATLPSTPSVIDLLTLQRDPSAAVANQLAFVMSPYESTRLTLSVNATIAADVTATAATSFFGYNTVWTVTAVRPYYDGSGVLLTDTTTVTRTFTHRHQLIFPNTHLTEEQISFNVSLPIPLGASQVYISLSTQNFSGVNYIISGFNISHTAVDIFMQQTPPSMKPAIWMTGLPTGGNPIIPTVVMGGTMCFPASSVNALIVPPNPVNPASSELLRDLAGLKAGEYARNLALVPSTSANTYLKIPASALTPAVAHVAHPDPEAPKSGTFIAGLAPILGRIAPYALSFAKNLLPVAGQMLGGLAADAETGRKVDPATHSKMLRGDLKRMLREILLEERESDTGIASLLAGLAGGGWLANKILSKKNSTKDERRATDMADIARKLEAQGMRMPQPPKAASVPPSTNPDMQPGAVRKIRRSHTGGATLSPTQARVLFQGKCPQLGELNIAAVLRDPTSHEPTSLETDKGSYKLIWSIGELTPGLVVVASDGPRFSLSYTGSALVQGIQLDEPALARLYEEGRVTYGLGVVNRSKASLWMLLVTPLPVDLALPSLSRHVEYVQLGKAFVDKRLASSFYTPIRKGRRIVNRSLIPDLAPALTDHAYVTSICSLDTSSRLHEAYGGSLIGPMLSLLGGFAPHSAVLSGSPFTPRGVVAAYTDRMADKKRALQKFASGKYRAGPVPKFNPFPTNVLGIVSVSPDCPPPANFAQTVRNTVLAQGRANP